MRTICSKNSLFNPVHSPLSPNPHSYSKGDFLLPGSVGWFHQIWSTWIDIFHQIWSTCFGSPTYSPTSTVHFTPSQVLEKFIIVCCVYHTCHIILTIFLLIRICFQTFLISSNFWLRVDIVQCVSILLTVWILFF